MTIYNVTYSADNDVEANTLYTWLFNDIPIPFAVAATFDDAAMGLQNGYLDCLVQPVDAAGRRTAQKSNRIFYPAVNITAPGKMAAPTIGVITATQVQVNKSSPPADGGSPILGYYLRWSYIDGSAWTDLGEVVFPYTIGGLTPSTRIYTQTAAYNSVGPTWSDSASAVTEAAAVTQVPGQFNDTQWSIAPLGTAGDAVLTITQMPDPGSAPILGTKYSINGATAVDLGLSAPGSVQLLDKFTDGASTPVQILARNSVGDGPLATAKNVRTQVSSGVTEATQTAVFGANNRALEGGFKPINPATKTTWDLIGTPTSSSGTGAQIVGGRLCFTATGGGRTGDIWRCQILGGGAIDILIDNRPLTYAICNPTEWASVISAIGNTGGYDIYVRAGDYTFDTTLYHFLSRKYTGAGLRVFSESYNHKANYWSTTWNGLKPRFSSNVSIWGINFSLPNASGDEATGVVKFYGGCPHFNFRQCRMGGKYYDPSVAYPAGFGNCVGLIAIGSAGSETSTWSGVIEECLIEDVFDASDLTVNTEGSTLYRCNEINRSSGDNFKLHCPPTSNTGTHEIYWNVISDTYKQGGTHCDSVFQFAGSGTWAARNFVRNFASVMNVSNMKQPGLNYAGHHGMTAFDDSQGTSPGTKCGIIMTTGKIVGNFTCLGGNHALSCEMDGGIVKYNTFVCPVATGNPVTPPRPILTGSSNAGNPTPWPNAPVDVAKNIYEGSAYTSEPTNVILGQFGATIPYTTVFDGPTFDTTAQNYDEVKTKWRPKTQTHGAFSEIGVYGTPRDKASWSFFGSLVGMTDVIGANL